MRGGVEVFIFTCLLTFIFFVGCAPSEDSGGREYQIVQQPLSTQAWTKVEPGGETACSRGTPFWFWAKGGATNKLLVYFLGGGACWSADTCSVEHPFFNDDIRYSPENLGGVFETQNPENPFADWNILYIPYCTGDTHWGNNVYTYKDDDSSNEVTVYHKGFVNSMSAVQWAFDAFENPETVFLMGDSAGAYGSIMFAPYLMDHYKESRFVQLGDSGAGVSNPSFRKTAAHAWNAVPSVSPLLKDYFDEANESPESVTIPLLYEAVASRFPAHRFAQFNTVQDKTQKFFYRSIGGFDSWQDRMEENIAFIDDRLSNFNYFTGWGEMHVATIRDVFYTYQVNGVRLRDWVDDLARGVDVDNVHCTDCILEELYQSSDPPTQPYQDPKFKIIPQGSAQCGPASLYTVFHYFQAEDTYSNVDCKEEIDLSEMLDEVTDETAFCRWVNSASKAGTSWDELKYAVKDLRVDCQRVYAVELNDDTTAFEDPMAIQERLDRLEKIHSEYLTQMRPVIIHLRREASWLLSGHYLVLTGYDKERKKVFYADPNRGQEGAVSLDRFLKEKWYRSPSNEADYNLAYWDGEWMGFYKTDPENAAVHDSAYDIVLDQRGISKALIVNGDDLGRDSFVNEGIFDTLENGLLTSASLQTPTDAISEAYERLANGDFPGAMGVHLTLSRPKWYPMAPLSPLNEVRSLVGWDDLFPTSVFTVLLRAQKAEAEKELRAQIENALSHNVKITHLDCHDGWCHALHPALDEVYLTLAKEYNLPVRWKFGPNGQKLKEIGLAAPHNIIVPSMYDKLGDYEKRKQNVLDQIRKIKRGEVVELVLHPQAGEVQKDQEYKTLDYKLASDPEVKEAILDEKVSLVSYELLKEIQSLME